MYRLTPRQKINMALSMLALLGLTLLASLGFLTLVGCAQRVNPRETPARASADLPPPPTRSPQAEPQPVAPSPQPSPSTPTPPPPSEDLCPGGKCGVPSEFTFEAPDAERPAVATVDTSHHLDEASYNAGWAAALDGLDVHFRESIAFGETLARLEFEPRLRERETALIVLAVACGILIATIIVMHISARRDDRLTRAAWQARAASAYLDGYLAKERDESLRDGTVLRVL